MTMMMKTENTDYELVQKCLEGDQDCFAELVTRYKKLVYNIVYRFVSNREEVEDISQEVFLRIYKSLHRYNPQFKFSTWSARIATNLCLDMARKKKLNTVAFEEIERISRDDNTPEQRVIKKERASEIRRAIEELPEKYRTPILLFHKNGASYKEISEAMDKPMSIIKNRLYRARLKLRENVACFEV